VDSAISFVLVEMRIDPLTLKNSATSFMNAPKNFRGTCVDSHSRLCFSQRSIRRRDSLGPVKQIPDGQSDFIEIRWAKEVLGITDVSWQLPVAVADQPTLNIQGEATLDLTVVDSIETIVKVQSNGAGSQETTLQPTVLASSPPLPLGIGQLQKVRFPPALGLSTNRCPISRVSFLKFAMNRAVKCNWQTGFRESSIPSNTFALR
jgi:hypothetical protein